MIMYTMYNTNIRVLQISNFLPYIYRDIIWTFFKQETIFRWKIKEKGSKKKIHEENKRKKNRSFSINVCNDNRRKSCSRDTTRRSLRSLCNEDLVHWYDSAAVFGNFQISPWLWLQVAREPDRANPSGTEG